MSRVPSVRTFRKLVFIFVLLALFLGGFTALRSVHAAGVQPMGILPGSIINFGSGGDQFLTSFCLDAKRSAPDEGHSFNNFSGNIRLTFNNGEIKNYDLSNSEQQADAFKHFKLEGAGTLRALRFVKTNPNLKNIEFLSPGLAHTGEQADFNNTQRYLQTFESLTSTLPRPVSASQVRDTFKPEYFTAQGKIWRNPHIVERLAGENKSITFDYFRRDPNKTALQQFINLDGRGDAILVQYGTVNLLIDSGMTAESFARIAPKLPKDIRLNILLTHRDQDHIGNMKRLLETSRAAGIKIENIFMSTFEVPPFDERNVSMSVLVRQLLQELKQRQYIRRDLSDASAIFSLPGSEPILQDKVTLADLLGDARKEVTDGGIITKLLTADEKKWLVESAAVSRVELHELSLSPDLKIHVFQKRNPKTSNESSLVTKITHNGRSTMYTGDMNENTMEDLLAFDGPDASRRGGIARLQMEIAYLKASHQAEYSRLVEQLQSVRSVWEAEEIYYRMRSSYLRSDAVFEARIKEMTQPTLAANTLKWPHHAWLPRTNRGREILKRFITAVAPQTIVFSISPETSEVKFSATEFVNAESFVSRLKAGPDPLSIWLRQNFSEATRRLVLDYESGEVHRQFKEALAQELTRLIKGPLMYSADRFSGLDLGDLAARVAGPVAESDRPILNRQLLEIGFSREIGQIRGQNVEKVKAFLRESFPYREFNIVMTPDGDIRFLTLNGRGAGFNLERAGPLPALSDVYTRSQTFSPAIP